MSVHTIAQFIPLVAVTIVENVRTKTGLDPASLKELSESIKTHGVLQPIIVAKTGDGYAVIAGQRRTLAAKLAGLDAIPALVTDGSEEGESLKAMQIVENLHRENLSLSETCGAVRDMLAMVGKPAMVAKRLAKSAAWVSKHLSPSGPSFNQHVRNLIADGKLNDVETALMLNQISKIKGSGPALEKLLALASLERLSRAQVRAELDRLKNPDEGEEGEDGESDSPQPTGKQQITVNLPADLAAIFEAVGAEKWLKRELTKLKESQGELPV